MSLTVIPFFIIYRKQEINVFKWLKLFGEQYIGLWLPGIVLFALQEVPYMVMPLFKLQNNPIMNMQESSVTLDIVKRC